MPEPGQRIGDYLLVEKIGQGGFGEVWKARHHLLDKSVAVKLPTDPAYVDQLRREGTIQRALRHENIVQTLELDPAAASPYFIMELVEGRSLRQLLQRRVSLSFHESVGIGLQVLSALQFAHERGVVHRDIKPGNILVSPGAGSGLYHVKVTDFGLGHVSESLASSMMVSGGKSSSQGRTLAGTMDYMSPQQKKGEPADPRNDLYAFGLVFYEMLVGKLPVGAFPFPSEIHADIPARVDDFIRRCLAPEMADRFAGAEEAAGFLQNLPEGSAAGRGSPLVLSNGREVFRLGELVSALEESPEDGRAHLYEGDLSPWLRSIREKALARLADRIRREDSDPEVGFQKFLEGTGMVPVPGMDLDVGELDLGEIPPGKHRTFRIHVARVGRGILWGKAEVEGTPRWVRPGSVHFKGVKASVEFTLATANLVPGREYELRVLFESNGGSKPVPVRFRVGTPGAKLECPVRELEIPLPGGATLLLKNSGVETLRWSAYGFPRWLDVPLSGEIPPGKSRALRVKVRSGTRDTRDLECRLMLKSNGGETSVRITTTTR